MPDSEKERDAERRAQGPSWGLMLFLIAAALLAAAAIAWAFIHPMMHPH